MTICGRGGEATGARSKAEVGALKERTEEGPTCWVRVGVREERSGRGCLRPKGVVHNQS